MIDVESEDFKIGLLGIVSDGVLLVTGYLPGEVMILSCSTHLHYNVAVALAFSADVKSNQILLGKYQLHYMYIHIDISNNIY